MKVFTVIETAELEILSVRTFQDQTKAQELFDKLCADSQTEDAEENDLIRECEGTITLSGDDAYAVQMVETEIM